jgi:hypothetical protein
MVPRRLDIRRRVGCAHKYYRCTARTTRVEARCSAPDHDWPFHINAHQVEQRRQGEDYPDAIQYVFRSMSDHPKFDVAPLLILAKLVVFSPNDSSMIASASSFQCLAVMRPAAPRSGSVSRPSPIQNNSGLLRTIQVCPKDLPIRSVAG